MPSIFVFCLFLSLLHPPLFKMSTAEESIKDAPPKDTDHQHDEGTDEEEFTVVDVSSSSSTSDLLPSKPSSQHTVEDTNTVHNAEGDNNNTSHAKQEGPIVDIQSNDTPEAEEKVPPTNDKEIRTSPSDNKDKEGSSSAQLDSTATETTTTTSSSIEMHSDVITDDTDVWKDKTDAPTLTTPTLALTDAAPDPWKEEPQQAYLHQQDDDTIQEENEKDYTELVQATTEAATPIHQKPPPVLDTETSHRKVTDIKKFMV